MWRVYYDDGVTHHDIVNERPYTYGVLCILQCVDGIYNIVFGCKYYMQSNGVWLHATEHDLVDYIIRGKPIDKLLVGSVVSNTAFNEVYEKAKRDKDCENL